MQKDKKQEIKEEKEEEKETDEEQEEVEEETETEELKTPSEGEKKYYPRAVSIEQMFNAIDDKLDLILNKK